MNQKKMANTTAELVFIPAAGLGHIMSTIEIAKVLVNRDQRLSITVLVIKPLSGFGSGSEITNYVESLTSKAMERIRFMELPQDETPPKPDPKAPLTFLNDYMNSHCKYVRNIVGEMMKQPGSGRIAGFVIDLFCTGMIDVASEFGIPTYIFFTSNAAFLGFNLYMKTLYDTRNQDHVAEFSNSDAEFLITSFVNPVPTKVIPELFRTKEGLDFLRSSHQKMKEAKGIMVNTFLELETHAIESFSSLDNNFPTVYPVGPVLNLDGVGTVKPKDRDIMSWLDGQQPSTVVLLCFGSAGSFDEIQVKVIAHALERSGHYFVWSLRRRHRQEQMMNVGDYEDPRVVLPEGFLERTVGVGKVIGWAPQAALLAHRAIGGFVSHCGWNSVLESLWFGVPLATWPMYAEQQLNAFGLVVESGLAVEIKLDYTFNVFNPDDGGDTVIVTAAEIERGIRQLMDNTQVRGKVKEMSRKSRAAVEKGGSSFISIGHLINEFLSNIS
ncbi:hypothetical protein L6452_30119 [Arctium lappa]|uniref:Uncharacterized protein n=1 Tax=Arctium lappa TaxID=4217 RepID=A0ACB8ZI04_ARCLA|nr:hypothetical protein L6452_30119 [Arctium lappa]